MNIQSILKDAVNNAVSDVFLTAGLPVSFRKGNTIEQRDNLKLMPLDTEKLIMQIYDLAGNRDINPLLKKGDDDFSFSISGLSRFRVNAFKQRGSLSAVIRVITFTLPNYMELGLPKHLIDRADIGKGMVLVTGSASCGKSTTLACMIDAINRTRHKHIITLEDPLEYLHHHNQSIVTQREIHEDTESYVAALRSALRQSPDVILLGEMRDYETIQIAITAAETGHTLLSTLHTIGAANTIDRIIDVFPANQQRQIAAQLSMVLSAVISQQLVPAVDGSMVPAFEIMVVNPAIRNMIRESKIAQLDGLICNSGREDLLGMDVSLLQLHQQGRITTETALQYASHPEQLEKKLKK